MMMMIVFLCLSLADKDNVDDDVPNANPSRGCLEAITALVGVNTVVRVQNIYVYLQYTVYNIVARVQSHKDIYVYVQHAVYNTAYNTIY